jgi:hypothetical protein
VTIKGISYPVVLFISSINAASFTFPLGGVSPQHLP